MARENAKTLSVEAVRAYVDEQLLGQQVSWMDNQLRSDATSFALAGASELVMDKLYEFANAFWDAEIPAPGQGYAPPVEVYAQVVRDRELANIDAQMAELSRRRQEVIDGPPETPGRGPTK